MKNKLLLIIAVSVVFLLIIPACLAASRDDALAALQTSEATLSELIASGEPHLFVNDTLYLAYQAFERAEYAELLKNNSLEGELIEKARDALKGLDEEFEYSAVIELTDKVQERKEWTYLLKDSIRALELKLNDISIDTSAIQSMLEDARLAYAEERFDDAEPLISDANMILSEKLSEQTTLKALSDSGKYLIQKFWATLLTIIVIIVAALLIFWKKIKRISLKKKYKKMKAERSILIDLIKETQRQRYESGTISEYLYNIKIKRYRERLAKLKAELPVMKKSLKRKI